MKVAVIGIGYVGAVSAACLCKSGHQVIAVDIDEQKVTSLKAGQSPIVEKDLDDLIRTYAGNDTLSATTDLAQAIQQSDISLICVGTPSKKDGSLDLSYVEAACLQIGQALKTKKEFHTVVIRSTLLPGSAEDSCLPVIEEASDKKAGIDFGFGHNPEFLREGSAVLDYFHPPKIVVGTLDEKSADTILSLYKNIDAPRIKTSVKIAEGVKYAANAWHALKIGFANEMGNILHGCGVDSHEVMDIFCLDTKLNISRAYLRPGFSFGGSCLPKDIRAICAHGKDAGVDTPLLDSLMVANDIQIKKALDIIRKSGKKNISLLGLSFKAGTDDVRESPLLRLAEKLIQNNYQLKIYDPNVSQSQMQNAALPSYILEHLCPEASNFIEHGELFIIGHSSNEYDSIIRAIEESNSPLLDLVRKTPSLEKKQGYHGICWA